MHNVNGKMQNIRVTLKCIAWSRPRLLIFGLKTGGLKGQPGPTRNSYLARLDWHRANVLFAELHPDNVIALSRRYLLQFNFGHFDRQNVNYTKNKFGMTHFWGKEHLNWFGPLIDIVQIQIYIQTFRINNQKTVNEMLYL